MPASAYPTFPFLPSSVSLLLLILLLPLLLFFFFSSFSILPYPFPPSFIPPCPFAVSLCFIIIYYFGSIFPVSPPFFLFHSRNRSILNPLIHSHSQVTMTRHLQPPRSPARTLASVLLASFLLGLISSAVASPLPPLYLPGSSLTKVPQVRTTDQLVCTQTNKTSITRKTRATSELLTAQGPFSWRTICSFFLLFCALRYATILVCLCWLSSYCPEKQPPLSIQWPF